MPTYKDIQKRKEQILREIQSKKSALEILEAKSTYWKYVSLVHGGRWIPVKFLIHICDTIDKFLAGELKNVDDEIIDILVLQLPPQHGKSQTVTETLPSYYLGNNPYDHVIEISYNGDLANRFGRRNKQKVEEFGNKIFSIQLAKDSTAADEFELAGTKGGMISRGIGASITGNPADLILIDDPYKNRQDADSPSYKKFVIDEWINSIKTRASAKCKFILIQTRWNDDDLAGYIQENESESCLTISFPCECEIDDEPVTGRKIGDALFPEIGKNNAWLKRFKRSFLRDPLGGLRAWNALFQQRPSSAEGNMFKRKYWRRYTLTLGMQFDQELQSWDCTFKDTDGTDCVAGHAWGRTGANCFLIDRDTKRMDIVKTMAAIIAMTKRRPKATAKLIEDKANGPAVITMLKRRIQGMIPIPATKGKGERANAVLPLFEAGNVFIPDKIEVSPGKFETCLWAEEVIDQFADFRPEKKKQVDDDVDAGTQALNRLMYGVTRALNDELPEEYHTDDELEDMGYKSYQIKKIKERMKRPWEK